MKASKYWTTIAGKFINDKKEKEKIRRLEQKVSEQIQHRIESMHVNEVRNIEKKTQAKPVEIMAVVLLLCRRQPFVVLR